MLILSRRPGEKIIIGDDIVIHVLPSNRRMGKATEIRLGITAPENVSIHRSEVYEKIKLLQESSDVL